MLAFQLHQRGPSPLPGCLRVYSDVPGGIAGRLGRCRVLERDDPANLDASSRLQGVGLTAGPELTLTTSDLTPKLASLCTITGATRLVSAFERPSAASAVASWSTSGSWPSVRGRSSSSFGEERWRSARPPAARGAAVLVEQDYDVVDPKDHLRYFTTFLGQVRAGFQRYVESSAHPDLAADGVAYYLLPLYLSDSEHRKFVADLTEQLKPLRALRPNETRSRRLLTFITVPAGDELRIRARQALAWSSTRSARRSSTST